MLPPHGVWVTEATMEMAVWPSVVAADTRPREYLSVDVRYQTRLFLVRKRDSFLLLRMSIIGASFR